MYASSFIRSIMPVLAVAAVGRSGRGAPLSLSNLLVSLQRSPPRPPLLADLNRFRSFSCHERKDAAYPVQQSDCREYYRCLGGRVFSYVCENGKLFDAEKEECAYGVTCQKEVEEKDSKPCLRQSDGFYPDFEQKCTAYYRCHNGVLADEGTCEDGATWDLATSSCSRSHTSSCLAPSCLGLRKGRHRAPSSACTAYLDCDEDGATLHVCPPGQLYDQEKQVCSTSVVCYDDVCLGRINGVYAAPNDGCHSYLNCYNGGLVKVEGCQADQVFDGWSCVRASNYSCAVADRGGQLCAGRVDGRFAFPDDLQCRSFYACRQQEEIRRFECDVGFVFNGVGCVESNKFACSVPVWKPDCTLKLEGFYKIEGKGCRAFYYCRNGTKKSEHTCAGKYIFNGKQCVDPQDYTCKEI